MIAVVMFCRSCGCEIVHRRAGLVHAETGRWRCRSGSVVKSFAQVGQVEEVQGS